jgi:PAS domain S-box-containing protein
MNILLPVKNEEMGIRESISKISFKIFSVAKNKKEKLNERMSLNGESQFRLLVETLPQLVWITDGSGNQIYASSRWNEYSGIQPQDESTWLTIIHPDDIPFIRNAWTKSVSTGDIYWVELRLKNRAGQYYWFYGSAEPVKNEKGKIDRWIGSFVNINEKKLLEEQLFREVSLRTSELQLANKQLKQSNEDLQQFAHVVSHDLKEPVRKVNTFCQRLQDEFKEILPERAAGYLQKIYSAGNRMYAMIEAVLSYSSVSGSEIIYESVELKQIFEAIENDLEIYIAEKNARIVYGDLPTAKGSSVLLYQLFYNLVNNSLKFTKPDLSPIVTIRTEENRIADRPNGKGDELARRLRISVSDNGIGFPKEDG